MMRKLYIIFYFVVVVLLPACIVKQPVQNEETILDLKVPVYEYQTIKMSDIISEYKIIPLEFTKNSMISGLFKITIHDNLIYILDSYGAQSVMVFNMTGKFIRAISSRGNGPGQMLYPIDFLIIPDEKRIDILGHKKVNSFSLDGKLIKENSIEFSSTKFIKLGDKFYFSAPWDKDCLLYQTDENFKFKKMLLKNRKKSSSGVIVYCPFTQNEPTSFTYWALSNDTVYAINEKNSYPSRAIDYGKYEFDYKTYSSLTSEEKALTMMNGMDKKEQCLLNKFFETKNYIELHYKIKGSHCAFIYNKKNESSIHYDQQHITDDITGLNVPGEIPSLIGCDNEKFYFMVAPYKYKSTKALLKFMNNASGNKEYTVSDLEKLSNNPIILIAKYEF